MAILDVICVNQSEDIFGIWRQKLMLYWIFLSFFVCFSLIICSGMWDLFVNGQFSKDLVCHTLKHKYRGQVGKKIFMFTNNFRWRNGIFMAVLAGTRTKNIISVKNSLQTQLFCSVQNDFHYQKKLGNSRSLKKLVKM